MAVGPMKQWAWKQRIKRGIERDQRWRYAVANAHWLCPFCGDVGARNADEGDRVDNILAHFVDKCTGWKAAKGDLLPVTALDQRKHKLELRERLTRDAGWRVHDSRRKWYCPYCAKPTAVTFPEGGKIRDETLDAVEEHLSDCYLHKEGKGPQTPDVLKKAAAAMEREESVTRHVRAELDKGPVWRQTDKKGRWVCPVCLRPVAGIDMSSEVNLLSYAPGQMTKHLIGPCPAYEKGPPTAQSIERLKAAIQKIDKGEITDSASADTAIRGLKSELRQKLAETAEHEQSLERARRIQQTMLPRGTPKVKGYDLYCAYVPSKRVSGDFYDYVKVGSHALGLVVGDVSGHGMEAALIVGMVKKVLSLRSKSCAGSPAQALRLANADVFAELGNKNFVTVSYGILDARQHRLMIARAGHAYPIIVGHAGGDRLQVVQTNGLGLGVAKGEAFDKAMEDKQVELHPGDLFVQYTDGVTEAASPDGEEFGADRLCEVLRASTALSCQELAQKIVSEVTEFTGADEQEDDIAVMCLKRL